MAQEGLEIGIDIMPQTHWIMNKTDFDRGDRLDHVPTYGVAFGVHAGLNFSNTLGLQIGVLYSAQGQDYENTTLSTPIEYSKELTYLKIPLLLKFNSNPDNGAYFQGVIGPQLGLLTKADVVGNAPNSLNIPTDKDAYKGSDFAAVIGLGMGINLSDNLKLGIMFRFDGSLGDIENKDEFWKDSFNIDREGSSNVTGGVMFSLNYIL